MNDVTFIQTQGGLNNISPNQDYTSGMIFYVNNYPVGFSGNTGNIQEIFSTVDALNLGVTDTLYPIENYQISEFFRIQPNAPLYLCFASGYTFSGGTSAQTYSEINDIQVYANGTIRQVGIFETTPFSTGLTSVGAIQTQCNNLKTNHMPLSVIFGGNTKAIALNNLPDLTTSSSPNVSIVIGQDSSYKGLSLYTSYGVSIPAVGATLGTISKSKVSENIGWVNNFDIKNNATLEYDEPAFGNGVLYKNQAVSLLNQLQTRGYIFIRKFVGLTGSYFNDSPTADSVISDYCYIERNRTIDKAIRNVRTRILPYVNSPLEIDPTSGKLSPITIASFKNECGIPLIDMVNNGEISGYAVNINPNQNVLSTNTLYITIAIVPIGVARHIQITIGFVLTV